jgi:drug/metabolite transporter (DMT)-like permease
MPSAPAAESLSHRRAYLLLSLGVFAIGWSALFVRWAGTAGMVSAFYRLAIAAVVLMVWRAVSSPTHTAPTPAARRAAIIAGIFFGVDLALFNTAVMTTTAMDATLLGSNSPIFVALGGWLMYRERPTMRFWIGFLVAITGVTSIVGADILLHPSFGLGDVFAVAGAACYGVYLLYIQRSRVGMDSLTFSIYATSIGALCVLPICLLTGQKMVGFSPTSWAALIGLALVAQVGGHWLVAHSMGRLPAAASSIVLLGQAPMTALLAWPLLDERPRPGQAIGGMLVLAGIMVVNLTRQRPEPTEPISP